MADLDHQHDQPLILDIADDPVVANLVAPEMREFGPLQRATLLAWIVERGYSLFEIGDHASSRRFADLRELLARLVI